MSEKFKAAQKIKQIYQKVRLKESLSRYAIRNVKADISEGESHFKSYVNNTIIRNIKMKGLKGLTYIRYQEEKLKEFLRKNKSMKIMVEASIIFEQIYANGGVEKEFTHTLNSRRYDILNEDDLKEALNDIPADIELQMENRYLQKSGLRIKNIQQVNINYDKYNPTRGGSYIQTPEWIALKRACINIKNDDNNCFKYSIQCGVYQIYNNKNPQEIRHYKNLQDDVLNWDNVKMPAGNKDIERLEESNEGIISVNVYEETSFGNSEKKVITLHRRTKVYNAKYHIDLLKLYNGSNYHYVLIKDYDELIGSQTNKHVRKLYHCRYCQHGFNKKNY